MKNTQEIKIKNMIAKDMYGVNYNSVNMTRTRILLVDKKYERMFSSKENK